MVERGGFEPPKASPPDLQSGPFGQLGNLSTRKQAESKGLSLFCTGHYNGLFNLVKPFGLLSLP